MNSRKVAVFAVVLTILICLGTAAYVGQVWWARKIAEAKITAGPPHTWRTWNMDDWWKAYPRPDARTFLQDWQDVPWYGQRVEKCWYPRRYHYEELKLLSGEDFGNDPDSWQAWFDAHQMMIWAEGPHRFAWKTADLLPYLKSPDPKIRAFTAGNLMWLGDKSTVTDIARLLNDKDPGVRISAAGSLGYLGATSTIPVIAKLLEDPGVDAVTGKVRQTAIQVLGNLGGISAATGIARFLSDPDRDMRCDSAEALGKLGAKHYASAIAKLLDERDYCVQRSAVEALGKITGQAWPKDEYRVPEAKHWWAAHKHDPEFAPAPPAP